MLSDFRVGRLRELLLKREIKAEELVAEVLDRVKTQEPVLNAFITITPEQALSEARAVDERLDRGEEVGPLAGIPYALKDNISTEGVRTTCASRMLDEYIPPFSAVVHTRLKDGGAILIGKSNMDELAMGGTGMSSFYGPTPNPWHLKHVPGGSSSASAASVAARQVCLSVGSDTGGSLRVPGAHCGVVALKPTYGLIPTDGAVEFAPSLDHLGPLTLDVAGAALALQVLSGGEDYTGALGKDIKGLKIGIPTELLEGATPRVRAAFDAAAAGLTARGATVEETTLPHAPLAPAAYFIISAAEASSALAHLDGVRFGHRAPAEHLQEMYLKSRSEGFGPDVRRRLIFGTLALSAGHYEEYYVRAQQARTLVIEDFNRAFGDYDLLVSPTTPTPPPSMSVEADALEIRLQDNYVIPANLAGLPALSLPVGLVGGLPVGMQLIGPARAENKVLRVAHALEQEIGFYRNAPEI